MHFGSGLGNQLFRFIGSRTLADRKHEEHGMVAPELFKGKDFMTLPIIDAGLEYKIQPQTGKVIIEDLKNVTVVDAEFQSEKDWDIDEVRKWLVTESVEIPDDVCIINFRGGEYRYFPELYLTKEYWQEAKVMMLQQNINMRFEVHTDDAQAAYEFFPDLKRIQSIETNWKALRYAKYAIISNSSFAILPRLLSGGYTIAPKFWAGHNKGYWQEPQNCYKKFQYI